MTRWYPGYEEHRVVFIDNTIPLALAIEHRNAILDSCRRPGTYSQAMGPIETPLDRMRPRLPSVQPAPTRRGRA